MAHIQELRRKIKETADLIRGYTGIIAESRSRYMYEMGVIWAQNFTMSTHLAEKLVARTEYWSFWDLEWIRVEGMFLDMIRYDLDRNEYYVYDEESELRVWAPCMILALYLEFMDQKMNDCQGNQVLMNLAFVKTVGKNGK